MSRTVEASWTGSQVGYTRFKLGNRSEHLLWLHAGWIGIHSIQRVALVGSHILPDGVGGASPCFVLVLPKPSMLALSIIHTTTYECGPPFRMEPIYS